jgi:molybdenum cofactor cytidylyltransferase
VSDSPTVPGLHALVLAAGEARRFGSAKQLLSIDGQPLLAHVAGRAAALVGAEALVVVLGARAGEIEAQLSACPGSRVPNPDWQEGIGSSLRAGIRSLPERCTAVLVLLADQAAVTLEDLGRLVETWRAHPDHIAAAAYGESVDGASPRTGVPAIFPRSFFEELARLSGDTGARALLARHRQAVQAVPMPSAAFDIDTPEDAARYLALAGGGAEASPGTSSPASARTR